MGGVSLLGWMVEEGFSEDVVSQQSTVPPHPAKNKVAATGEGAGGSSELRKGRMG